MGAPRRVSLLGVLAALAVVAGDAWGQERAGSDSGRERAPKTAGAEKASAAPDEPDVVATEVGEEGVKTYEFGAVEVEGRLRSPQMIYFLRRVRAQFDATGLGHRSFLRELTDTRRHPAFR